MGPPAKQSVDLVVAYLMIPCENQWDRRKLQLLLPEYEECILCLKQSCTGIPDKLIWLGLKSGEYKAKSGYYKVINSVDFGDGECIVGTVDWNKSVWRLDCAPNVKIFS